MAVPIKCARGTDRSEVMHRRDQRAFPSVEPPGAPVGEEVVDVDDVGAELFQFSERRGPRASGNG